MSDLVKNRKIFFIFAILWFCLGPHSVNAESQILLTQNANDYTIENEYYRAVIPTDISPDKGRGLVRYLYIKKSDGNFSNNLILEDTFDYGLGFLEGTGAATENRPMGLQGSDNVITILENTSSRITIRVTKSLLGTDFSEMWTFWAKKPYFRSEASAVVTDTNGYLTNQFQFAWMINENLSASWYGTDKDGNAMQFTKTEFQQIHSPNLGKYPWINWQFSGEGVSLGMVFTHVYDPLGTVAETGDWNFEYQLDFGLGSSVIGVPVKNGNRREVTTIYYTSNQTSYTAIDAFATNSYQGASTLAAENPLIQTAHYMSDPHEQNSGIGSAMISSPFFAVRQNTQNRSLGMKGTQYQTSIYAPLYKNQSAIHSGSYDFAEQLGYSLNYSDDSQTYAYGTVNGASASNSNSSTSLQNDATSSNGKLSYSTLFTTWSDSDKLQLTGSASNASSSAAIKDIYLDFSVPSYGMTYSEAENTASSSSVTSSLTQTDGLWTNYNYSYDSGRTLVYFDNQETVPALAIPVALPDGQYEVTAYAQRGTSGSVTYKYSVDNSSWNSFVVAQAGSVAITSVSLGVLNISNGVFYIDDDNDSSAGINGWGGWDRISFQPITVSLGSNVYDVRIYDAIYGKMGIGVKVNSPASGVSISNNKDIRVYLYQQLSAQTLTTFSYPFDIELYPHHGWLSASSDFTSLHSRANLSYTKHSLYISESTIHSGRTNTVYPNGTVAYSSEPYNDATRVSLSITPSNDSVSVAISTWNTSGDYSKSWTESSSAATSTEHTIGDLAPNGFYEVKVDGARYAQFRADAGGQGTFTYSGGYSTHAFEIVPDLSIGNGPIVGAAFAFPSPAVFENTNSTAAIAAVPSTQAISSAVSVTATPNITMTADEIKKEIAVLQAKLLALLEELLALLTEQLQNAVKPI